MVFYDYDELCLLRSCIFRALPQPTTMDEEFAGDAGPDDAGRDEPGPDDAARGDEVDALAGPLSGAPDRVLVRFT